MSDTPRTDANAGGFADELVSADFARQLERELTTSRADAASWKRQFESKSEEVAELEKRLFSMTQTALSEGVRAGKIERELAELNEWKAVMKGVEEFYAMRHQRDEWRKCAERLAASLMSNMRANNNVYGHSCTVGTREAHDEFVRLASKP